MALPGSLSSQELNDMREVAARAARLAGQELCRRLDQSHEITTKGLRDIVTEADLASERLILEQIRRHYPSHGVVSEEAAPGLGDLRGGFWWAVDPLDGTTNYARGLPIFSISVAALKEGLPVVGVVHEPLRDWTFSAQRGGGAFLNGSALAVGKAQDLLSAMVAFDWSREQRERLQVLAKVQRIGPQVGALRTWGSAALGLCHVAAGWVDAYFHAALSLWDMAAGVLLVEEAGGQVTQLNGRAWTPEATSILASNGPTHGPLLDLLRRTAPI